MIYWLKAGETSAVKVGYAARDVPGRVKDLQTGCPHLLVLLRQEPGERDLEAALHRHYRAKHLRAEWYVLDDADVSLVLKDVQPISRRTTPPTGVANPKRPRVTALPPVAAAIAAVGTAAKLARKVGVTKYAVQQWKASGIPPRRVGRVSSITGIPVHALRPDLFPAPGVSAAA